MPRSISFLLLILVLHFYSAQAYEPPSPTTAQTNIIASLDGTYEIDLEEVVMVKPEKVNRSYYPPEWLGIWSFHGSRFTQMYMKQLRDWPPSSFSDDDLGFDSSCGTFTVEGDRLKLKYQLSLVPAGVGQIKYVNYRLQQNTLTLTLEMHRTAHSLSEGTQTIKMHRIPE